MYYCLFLFAYIVIYSYFCTKNEMRKIELLSPARDLDTGIEAFRHGADAVYIGAPKFGARAAVGNPIEDIERLARFGHQFGAKTYAAFNTLLFDRELEEAERMAWQLYEAGVDALIVQDIGLLALNLPPIALHASTQLDNRTAEKVALLSDLGFSRVVIARELDVAKTRAIHERVPAIELETFIHGALCVGVSGQCYLSAALTERSANRGVCAQPCRLPMDLLNANGKELVHQKHLLNLKDLCRASILEQLLDAGVTSLKIEGRLKDVSYVKNITAFYRHKLDEVFEHRPADFCRLSEGNVSVLFTPSPDKSFNRGFTDYQSDRDDYFNFDTCKSVGQHFGRVTFVGSNFFEYKPFINEERLNNGDGVMIGKSAFRINRTQELQQSSNFLSLRAFPLDKRELALVEKGMDIFRNLDYRFEEMLKGKTANRRIPVNISLNHDAEGCVTMSISDGIHSVSERRGPYPFREVILPPEKYANNVCRLGETMFELRKFDFSFDSGKQVFIPISELNDIRRSIVAGLVEKRLAEARKSKKKENHYNNLTFTNDCDAREIIPTDFRANALNNHAKDILSKLKLERVDDGFEIKQSTEHPVMLTRHCLKYALGHCPKYGKPSSKNCLLNNEEWKEPISIRVGNNKFILKFGCKNDCFCEIFTIFAPK